MIKVFKVYVVSSPEASKYPPQLGQTLLVGCFPYSRQATTCFSLTTFQLRYECVPDRVLVIETKSEIYWMVHWGNMLLPAWTGRISWHKSLPLPPWVLPIMADMIHGGVRRANTLRWGELKGRADIIPAQDCQPLDSRFWETMNPCFFQLWLDSHYLQPKAFLTDQPLGNLHAQILPFTGLYPKYTSLWNKARYQDWEIR